MDLAAAAAAGSEAVWVDCYEPYEKYQISQTGGPGGRPAVRNAKTRRHVSQRKLGKYANIRLCSSETGEVVDTGIHRVMALTFMRENKPPGDAHVDHRDNDPRNNSLDNLQWLAPKDNIAKRLFEPVQTKARSNCNALPTQHGIAGSVSCCSGVLVGPHAGLPDLSCALSGARKTLSSSMT